MFNISAAAGIGLIALFGAMVFGTNQAFPFFIGNAGSFLISADELDATEFNLVLGVDDNSSESGGALPTGELQVGQATIKGLTIQKAFNVRSVVGDVAQPEWKLTLTTGDDVTLTGSVIRSIGLCGSRFEAGQLEIDAAGANTPTFLDDFSLTSGNVLLIDGAIEATYLATDNLAVSGLSAVVSPGGYEKPACLP
jgi:hypothetical protein